MLYKEFEEKIAAGDYSAGDSFWVTDFRHDNVLEKPIRNVKPTEVRLFPNDELPKNKKVYYADYHFRPYGKTGKVMAQIIAPYDNTGFRSYTGNSLNIFLSKDEAEAHYIAQCEIVRKQVADEMDKVKAKLDKVLDSIDESIRNL